jgi:hypothetical protein
MRRAAAVLLAALALLPTVARAQSQVAADDPALRRAVTQMCLRAALTSGGIDKGTKPYCDCVAPILARHMTAESRYRLAVQNRLDQRPSYDDDKAAFDEVMKTCPLQH